jgi:hypothetical protein
MMPKYRVHLQSTMVLLETFVSACSRANYYSSSEVVLLNI